MNLKPLLLVLSDRENSDNFLMTFHMSISISLARTYELFRIKSEMVDKHKPSDVPPALLRG